MGKTNVGPSLLLALCVAFLCVACDAGATDVGTGVPNLSAEDYVSQAGLSACAGKGTTSPCAYGFAGAAMIAQRHWQDEGVPPPNEAPSLSLQAAQLAARDNLGAQVRGPGYLDGFAAGWAYVVDGQWRDYSPD